MGSGPVAEALPRVGRGTGPDTESGGSRVVTWDEAAERLRAGGWFWISTVSPDGAPHTVPVFAVWDTDALFVAAKDTTRKSRNLVERPACTVATDAGDLHLVVEGRARRAQDESTLRRASAAFREVYDWPTEVVDGLLDAPYGAPTSGGPPYAAHEITPVTAFAFPADGETFAPTRWRFGG